MKVNGEMKDKVATPTLFKEPAALDGLVGIQRPPPLVRRGDPWDV